MPLLAAYLLVLLWAILAPLAACAEHLGESEPFPIMAWDYADDEATLQKMADCGINMVAFVPPEALDLCQKFGIRAIVYQEGITPPRWDQAFNSTEANAALPELIKRVNDHPAVYGYHLKDEPGADQFAELGKSVALVKELAPGKWPYINMTPGMGKGYDDFLEMYFDACQPPILSYDNYAVGQDGSFSPGFWANIAAIRNAALRHDVPFYNIFLTSAHLTYGEPDENHLRLQAWGSLVYGARGLCCYKFISASLPILEAPDLGDWRNGPLDQFGEKTHTWYWLRNLNRQVQNYGPTLVKLRSDVVYHIGEVPEHNRGVGDDSLVKGLKAGEAFVIGDFTHKDGSRWVMIVNKHLKNSVQCIPEFRDEMAAVEYLSPITGELKSFPTPWYCLPPGQGVLLKLTPKPENESESENAE